MSPAISRLFALTAAVTLLGVTACKSVNEPAAQPAAAQSVAGQSAPEAAAAPKAAESPIPSQPQATPVTAAKPVEAAPAGTAAEPASETKSAGESKLATAASEATPPAAKPAAPAAKAAAPAARADVLTKDQALALASKGNCLACHKIESRVVGPAWKDVAAKYKGDANAVGTITSHIKSGGSFGWKFGVMPPRGGSNISDADVANLAKFIASLK